MSNAALVRKNREYRLELLLLGMALGRDGDREKIIDRIDTEKLQSPLAACCYKAVATRSPFDIDIAKEAFKLFGFNVGDNICESLIAQVNLNNARRELQRCMDLMQVQPSTDISQAIADVEFCVSKVKKVLAEKEALV